MNGGNHWWRCLAFDGPGVGHAFTQGVGRGCRVVRALGACFNCSDFHPLRRRVVRGLVDGGSSLMLVPAKKNGSVYCRLPTLLVRNATVIVSPLVSLVGSRMRALHTGKVPTNTLGDDGSRARGTGLHETYVSKRLGLLCVSPRGLLSRTSCLLESVALSLFTISRTRYVSR